MKFSLAIARGVGWRLKSLVAEHAAAEQTWWGEQVRRKVGSGRGRGEREARTRLRRERVQRREAGELLGTRQALLAHSTRIVLEAHAWDKEYQAVPAEAVTVGRPWGYSPPPTDEEGHSLHLPDFPERLDVELPDDLGVRVQRAAYWESLSAVTQLQEWFDRFGDGPRPAERELGVLGLIAWEAGGGHPTSEDLENRGRLRGQVVTVGDILRLAIDQALTVPSPPVPPVPPESDEDEVWIAYRHDMDRFLQRYTRRWSK